jgi:small redox-active disulfide protein 2
MIIKVLGPGCTNCQNLEKAVRGALAGLGRLGLEATVEKVTDYGVIAGYGVMSTPALVIDEKVVLAGRVPTVAQVRDLLMAATPSPKS